MRFSVWSVTFFCVAITAQAVPQTGQNLKQESQRDTEVYESVVRFQIKSWELAAATFCIRVNRADADEALLNRLRPLPVKAASACKEASGKTLLMKIVDRRTKKNSVIFDVGAIRRLNESETDVEGGYLCGSLCMASGVYRIVREESGWRVTGFKWNVIS